MMERNCETGHPFFKVLLVLLMLTTVHNAASQTTDTTTDQMYTSDGFFAFCIPSVNCGRQYIFAPTSNYREYPYHVVIGMIFQTLGQEETDIRVSFPGRSYEDHVILPAGSPPYNYTLPASLISQEAEAGIINSTVFVTSEQDVAIVSYNIAFKTSDTFSLIPAKFLGKEYFITLISGLFDDTIMISAFKKIVMVEIFLTSSIQLQNDTYNDGDTVRLVLLPFDSFQLISNSTNITGSRITANSSIAVTVSTECANVPEDIMFCDHLAEQLAPVKAWGMLHVLSPFPRRLSGYVFQIVASRNGTTAMYDNNTVNMNMGDYITVDNPSQNMTFVYADKPISVMQYSKGRSLDNNSYSDPSMIRVNPIKQYVTRTTIPVFEFNKTSSNDTTYIGMTAECKQFRGISIYQNEQLLSVPWDEEYSLQILDGIEMCSKWMVATHGRYSVESDGQGTYPGFHAVVYGTSFGRTYLYRAGSSDKDLTTSEENCVIDAIPFSNQTRVDLVDHGASIVVACNTGYSTGMGNLTEFMCDDGTLTDPPVCFENCVIDAIPFSNQTRVDLVDHGASIVVACHPGYSTGMGNLTELMCDNGTLTEPPVCYEIFPCSLSNMDVPMAVVCDGYYDCDHYEDESNCNNSVTYLEEGQSLTISTLSNTGGFYNTTLLKANTTNGFRIVFHRLHLNYDDEIRIGTGNDPSDPESIVTTVHGYAYYAEDVYIDTHKMWVVVIGSKQNSHINLKISVTAIDSLNFFPCTSSSMNLSVTLTCDRYYDCDNYEDESSCSKKYNNVSLNYDLSAL
ncbi:uncharacterized protein LOC121423489 [Lytechinus variegatus]|uniref:uncharacterized protein LOC121423489 n=1 Tax=Lytechinus variegatus TaxID=7654 RepID=UPI001BB1EFC7|nr:uncharacterized protein LOC121423489 [Lytechinus variegatus]